MSNSLLRKEDTRWQSLLDAWEAQQQPYPICTSCNSRLERDYRLCGMCHAALCPNCTCPHVDATLERTVP